MKSIGEKHFKEIKNWFTEYVRSFKDGNEIDRSNIVLKEDHTLRVCKEILYIGKKLGLDDNELRLAEIIALLHDIGRFEQYAVYNTFADRNSENHAALGIKVLKKYNVLNKLDTPTERLIFRIIDYHNRASLPPEEEEQSLFFMKLLRDADKLDILKVVTDYYHRKEGKRNKAIELDLPDTPGISEKVYQDLIHKRIVNANHMKNLNDFKLLQTGWIFDINFKPTLQCIKSRRYIEMIRKVLPETDEIREIFNVVQDHLDRQSVEIPEE